jgi:hypothetical protein
MEDLKTLEAVLDRIWGYQQTASPGMAAFPNLENFSRETENVIKQTKNEIRQAHENYELTRQELS